MSNNRIDLSKENFQELQVQLLSISYSKYEGDWNSKEHTHKFSELFYITNGKGKFKVEESVFDVKQHDLIIVNPKVLHKEISVEDYPLEYIVLGIDGLSFMGENDENYIDANFSYDKEDIFYYIERILRESELKEKKYAVVCQRLLEILILNISRKSKFNLEVIATNKDYKKETLAIIKYIDKNFREDITLDDIANHLHLSKFYIAHSFKNDYGLSPINYLLHKRISESKMLLKTTDLSICDISDTLGFSSQSYFSQQFKKSTSYTPKEYRQKHNNDIINPPARVYKKTNIINNT